MNLRNVNVWYQLRFAAVHPVVVPVPQNDYSLRIRNYSDIRHERIHGAYETHIAH